MGLMAGLLLENQFPNQGDHVVWPGVLMALMARLMLENTKTTPSLIPKF
jgi:hypothetical protein